MTGDRAPAEPDCVVEWGVAGVMHRQMSTLHRYKCFIIQQRYQSWEDCCHRPNYQSVDRFQWKYYLLCLYYHTCMSNVLAV